MPDEHVPVLIVGGSLVGLTTAMRLGHHAGQAIHPRAGHFQLRTMAICSARASSYRGPPETAGPRAYDAELFVEAYGLEDGGATLVRPVGVVAWRARGLATHGRF